MTENIFISSNLNLDLEVFINNKKYSTLALLVDENTQKYCLPYINLFKSNQIIVIPSGEKNKNLSQCEFIWSSMDELGLDRHSCLINLGGGVLCDMGSFCAATYKRGIDFINIPSTLLAMTDAAIGGKTGVNFNSNKNHIGLFKNATATIIFPELLSTLNKREITSGYAEILKHGIIADKNLWTLSTSIDRDLNEWKSLIERSFKVKLKIVESDFEEKGLRKILNFGHTVGHQIESFHLDNGEKIKLHGEAIAEGMIIESIIAIQKSLLAKNDFNLILDRIKGLFELEDINSEKELYILENIIKDKKSLQGKVYMPLPLEIGRMKLDVEISLNEIKSAIAEFNKVLK